MEIKLKKDTEAVLRFLHSNGPATKEQISENLGTIAGLGRILGSLRRFGYVHQDDDIYHVKDEQLLRPRLFEQPNRPNIKKLKEDLDWLFTYVEQLEQENQSLYKSLCTYGTQADRIRTRYENRLQALTEPTRKSA